MCEDLILRTSLVRTCERQVIAVAGPPERRMKAVQSKRIPHIATAAFLPIRHTTPKRSRLAFRDQPADEPLRPSPMRGSIMQ